MITALIPARRGSKRVPCKNLRNCGGHPLVAYSVRAAVEANGVGRVFVSSDCDEILEVGRRYGAEPIKRPAELALDDSPTEEAIAHAVAHWDRIGVEWSGCLLLQPTSPLRGPDRVAEAAEMLSLGYDPVISVTPDPGAYFRGTVRDGRYEPHNTMRKRTQDLHWVYRENGAVYGFSRDHWNESECRTGPSARALIMRPHESLDVDDEHDLMLADAACWRAQLRRQPRIQWPLVEWLDRPEGKVE